MVDAALTDRDALVVMPTGSGKRFASVRFAEALARTRVGLFVVDEAHCDLDAAIVRVVVSAAPPVGRTRAVEILRGGRSRVIAQHAYDRLAGYGAFAHLHSREVLGRVDELLAAGTLRSAGGRFPKLRVA